MHDDNDKAIGSDWTRTTMSAVAYQRSTGALVQFLKLVPIVCEPSNRSFVLSYLSYRSPSLHNYCKSAAYWEMAIGIDKALEFSRL